MDPPRVGRRGDASVCRRSGRSDRQTAHPPLGRLDDAAAATVAALERGARGVYNITDDDPAPVSQWLPYLAEVVGAKPPMRVPTWLARQMAGAVTVRWTTRARGSSNEKAKRELDWQPMWRSWREGFRKGLEAQRISA